MDGNRRSSTASICKTEKESWETIWKWAWFTREMWAREYWKANREALKPMISLLHQLNVKTILDCSCGLGFKTIIIAKKGYEVEGSDESAVALKCAPLLAKEQGLNIRFFRSRMRDLKKNSGRRYDCVVSDYFDELGTRRVLRESARGIYGVLNDGGKFIFESPVPGINIEKMIEDEWKKREKLEFQPPYEKGGTRVTKVEVAEKTPEGILERCFYHIEEKGSARVEIAFKMNPRIKWTLKDFIEVLVDAGFMKFKSSKKEGRILNVAIK